MSVEQTLVAKLEALLFAYGEAMAIGKIAKLLGQSEDAVRGAIDALKKSLREEHRGLVLLENFGAVELATKPEFQELVERLVKGEMQAELTPAAAETLSIIAYGGPVSRSEIDYIRGVNSSFTVRSLLLRGLVDRSPDPKRPNAFLYRASFAFLKHVGIAQSAELPEFEKLQEMMEKVRPKEQVTSNEVTGNG